MLCADIVFQLLIAFSGSFSKYYTVPDNVTMTPKRAEFELYKMVGNNCMFIAGRLFLFCIIICIILLHV